MNKAQETRKQKRLEKLGTNNPVCVVCGESDWRCLEEHHIAGQAYGDELSIVCRNCHRKLSDEQKDHPQKVSEPNNNFESIGHFLLGLADLFALIVDTLRSHGRSLIESAKGSTS